MSFLTFFSSLESTRISTRFSVAMTRPKTVSLDRPSNYADPVSQRTVSTFGDVLQGSRVHLILGKTDVPSKAPEFRRTRLHKQFRLPLLSPSRGIFCVVLQILCCRSFRCRIREVG